MQAATRDQQVVVAVALVPTAGARDPDGYVEIQEVVPILMRPRPRRPGSRPAKALAGAHVGDDHRGRNVAQRSSLTATKASAAARLCCEPRQTASARTASMDLVAGAGYISVS